MLEYVASQLGENPAAFDRYARSRDTTRREHFSEIMRTFGFRAFDERVYRELYRWLLPLVMSTERGTVLVEAALGEMRRRGIVAPAITTIEELCWEARRDARRSVFERLTADLSTESRQKLDRLIERSRPTKPGRRWSGCASRPGLLPPRTSTRYSTVCGSSAPWTCRPTQEKGPTTTASSSSRGRARKRPRST